MAEVLEPGNQTSIAKAGPFVSEAASSENIAVTIRVPFETVRSLIEGAPQPKRPSRTAPRECHSSLEEEMQAWEAASDELWRESV